MCVWSWWSSGVYSVCVCVIMVVLCDHSGLQVCIQCVCDHGGL